MKKGLILILCILLITGAKAQIHVWQKWTCKFVSEKTYENPYADVSARITFTGPDDLKFSTYCYWTGKQNFEASFSFPAAGKWRWELSCSDTNNESLNGKSGIVNVYKYKENNPLYLNGFLKVSQNKRYLVYDNDKPFLWMGCTAWNASVVAKPDEWKEYIDDRAKKHFSVIQITPFLNNDWKVKTQAEAVKTVKNNFEGEAPFSEYYLKINPNYWAQLAQKIQYANEKGLVVVLVGVPGWQYYITDPTERKSFARYLAGLFAGNFVIFSPSSDKSFSIESDEMGFEIDGADSRHLITQHPNTPSGKPVNTASEAYYDKAYLDFSMCQSGHNNGNSFVCAWNAVYWNFSLYNREPHKPVINGEAFYHGNPGASGPAYKGTDTDARSLGWFSWLSGSLGYTYGALGIWNWGLRSSDIFVPWREAMALNSSFQMQYMSDFFNKIHWWELAPNPQAVLTRADTILKQTVFAMSADKSGSCLSANQQ